MINLEIDTTTLEELNEQYAETLLNVAVYVAEKEMETVKVMGGLKDE